MGAWHLGIDLGTTNSAAAVFDGERVTLVRDSQGRTLTPSVVRIDARGNVTVGARARRALETDPDNTRSEFKRLMGTAHKLAFPASRQQKLPQELSAEVLNAIRQDVRAQLGFLPATAVISVPALFELPQNAATSEAARLAGFSRVEMIQEPVASAIAAGWKAGEDERPWLVYDLGGGTFDASLLETVEGLLRVVGHDGDNFLGGRDLDQGLVDWALDKLASQGVRVDPSDPAHATGLRKLRFAAEEAKIELARAREAELSAPGLFVVDGERIDVDLLLDRATLERVSDPLIERSINVCLRLLAAHGLRPGDLGRIVLVGGPTVMPRLRERVADTLGAPIETELDPMTLVAQGAAIFAATAGLDARPSEPSASVAQGPAVWLQYPSVSSDLTPFVVGRVLDRDAEIDAVRLRAQGWDSPPETLDEDGAFAIMVQLQPRATTSFSIEGLSRGRWIPLRPATLTMVHGVTLQDPPLSRSIGVALANDTVVVYFERGSPLPMRRTFTLHTVSAVHPSADGDALRVPIVQGELAQARLCRLVGALEIPARALRTPLPVGSPIEVALELDRGGLLRASARLPSGQIFEQIATMLVPSMTQEAMAEQVDKLRATIQSLRAGAFRRLDPDAIVTIGEAERLLDDAARSVALARGGDLDASERARRNLIEVDGKLASLEAASAWPAVEAEASRTLSTAVIWVGRHGTPEERELLSGASARLKKALAARSTDEVRRMSELLDQLADVCYLRDPNAWRQQLEHAASRVSECTDLRRANALVKRGREEMTRGDDRALEATVRELWRLLPVDEAKRRRSHGSGVR